jgi:hypothetical protein
MHEAWQKFRNPLLHKDHSIAVQDQYETDLGLGAQRPTPAL